MYVIENGSAFVPHYKMKVSEIMSQVPRGLMLRVTLTPSRTVSMQTPEFLELSLLNPSVLETP